jgi:CRP-like cAMP-binding protein
MELEQWGAIEERLTIQRLKKGEFLTRQGEVCRQVSFVNQGLLRMFYLVDGKEICTGFSYEGEYVSQYDSFLTQQPSVGNIDILEDAILINLSYEDMQELYKKHPVFQIFGRKIAEMLFIMIAGKSNSLLMNTPEERYQMINENYPYIIQRVPQYMIASFIGVSPEHLSRIRNKQATRKNHVH